MDQNSSPTQLLGRITWREALGNTGDTAAAYPTFSLSECQWALVCGRTWEPLVENRFYPSRNSTGVGNFKSAASALFNCCITFTSIMNSESQSIVNQEGKFPHLFVNKFSRASASWIYSVYANTAHLHIALRTTACVLPPSFRCE